MAKKCIGIKCLLHTPGDGSFWATDRFKVPLARVCEDCYTAKLDKFRPVNLRDPETCYCIDCEKRREEEEEEAEERRREEEEEEEEEDDDEDGGEEVR